MKMNNLNQNEKNFLKALAEDKKLRGDKSFLHVLFRGALENESEMRKILEEMFQRADRKNIISNSTLLLECEDSCFVGKYQNFFWATGSEGDLFGIGQEVQNIPFVLLRTLVGDIESMEGKKMVQAKLLKQRIDYFQYVEDYKNFCQKFNLTYQENLSYIDQQSVSFNQLFE